MSDNFLKSDVDTILVSKLATPIKLLKNYLRDLKNKQKQYKIEGKYIEEIIMGKFLT